MAYPASTTALADALLSLDRAALAWKNYATQGAAYMAANPVSANQVLQALGQVVDFIRTIDTVAAVPGIIEYAQAQKGDATLDVVAEAASMRANAIIVRDWIITNFPKDATGYLLKDTFDADGSISVRQFTSAQTVALQAALSASAAAVG
jgi:hypothetical protein